MQERGLDAHALEDLLCRKSGLLGVSGISSGMQALRQSTAPEAAEAIAPFSYRIVREIGSLAAARGGLDGLVFAAGIGELDAARNRRGDGRISADSSTTSVWVIPTDEERMIARYTREARAR